MDGEIDQKINAVGTNSLGQRIVREFTGAEPVIGETAQAARDLVRLFDVGVTVDLVALSIVIRQDRFDEVRDGVIAQIRRNVPDLQPPITRVI